MSNIAIFIPVFNEAEKLASVLGSIPTHIGGNPVTLFIVDDGSEDDSFAIAKQFTDHVIHSSTEGGNMGVGCATRIGFLEISQYDHFDYVIKFDGDGQHALELLNRVVDSLEREKDLVICSRFHPHSKQQGTPVDRMLLNRTFAHQLSILTGWHITDARSGFMGLQARHVKKMSSHILTRRYGIPMEIILRLYQQKPDAVIEEIAHPALYRGISEKLENRYDTEELIHKEKRFQDAQSALLSVLDDLWASGTHFKLESEIEYVTPSIVHSGK